MATVTLKTKNTPSNFGGVVNDGNRNALTGVLGSWIQTSDGTGTPVTSPVTVTTGTTLTIPPNAAQIVISSSAALRISELSDVSTYFVLPANVSLTIDVARLSLLYLKQDSGSCTVQFFMVMV
jgi:hypothetical protein